MNKELVVVPKNYSKIFLLTLALVVGGLSAQATGILNTSSGGYLLCVNTKTKALTHPGTSNCPKGSKKLVLGAQGAIGPIGLTGATGLSGRDGKDGKTLWSGVKDPDNSWGAPGDVFINSSTNTFFGPKNLDGTWPTGISIVGPKGDQGPIGLTGATGPQGPGGGSGPQGATGVTGAIGPAGTNGTNATLTCAQGGTCVIGDIGPGGGIVFIVQTATTAAPWRYMEAAPNTWNGGSADPRIEWCSNTTAFVPNLLTGETATAQTSAGIGTGYTNTQKMLRGCTYGAANAAAGYNGGGKSDWHLPSKDELNQLHLVRDTVGGFNDGGEYWSSSDYQDRTTAFTQVYNAGGIQTDPSKHNPHFVRPVRAF